MNEKNISVITRREFLRRAACAAVGTAAMTSAIRDLRFMNAAIAMAFPIAVHNLSQATPFVFFSVMTAVQFLVVLLVFPETKGQTLEALQRRLVPSE